jgi:4-amino-4-deoxy-L-arabinose transferase-like glycosyltransferase
MDGKLVLDGLVPIVDFDARQAFYVYLLAAWQRLVGSDLLAARVLPMLLGVAITGLVFALARYLAGTRAALVATATYAFLPVALIWSLNVHLQAVTLVFTCLGYLALARALRTGTSPRALAVVGVMFGITFYVRESALAHLLAAAIVVTVLGRGTPRRLAGQLAGLLGGFLAVALLTLALFARYLTVAELWGSPLNPLHLPLKAVGKLIGVGWGGGGEPASLRELQQPWESTLRNLRDAARLGSFLLIAAAGAFASRLLGRRRSTDPVAGLILTAWLGSLGLAYGYWIVVFGFYPQYFTELLPPLAILFGAVVSSAAEQWLPPRIWGPALGMFVVASAGAFAAGAGATVPALAYVALVALGLAAAGIGRAGLRRWWAAAAACAAAAVIAIALGATLPPGLSRAVRGLGLLVVLGGVLIAVARVRPGRLERLAFAVLVVLGGSALIAYDYAGRKIGVAYNCVWPPAVLDQVSREVSVASRPGDEVLSGAVIWAVQADRRPFLNISHPLGFLSGTTVEERRLIGRALAERPPRLIVLDGYTEKTLLADSVARARLLQDRYRPLGEVIGGRFPVRIFVLRPDVAAAPAPASPQGRR